jgi:uncharacterized membrane protein YdjX (TVP38/TMEM64 family)
LSSPSEQPPGRSRRFWQRAAVLALILLWPLLFLLISYVGWDVFQEWRHNGGAWEASKEKIRAWLDSLGPLAPVGFILLQALQVVVAPIPGEATGFLGGFLFGALPGFVYASLGLTLGSTLAFMVSRRLGARIMNRLTGTGRFEKFDALFEKNGALIALLLFLFPGAPKDYLSFLLGLTTMPFKVFVVLVTLGRMPATLMLTLQGAQVYQGNYWTFFILLGVTLGAGGLLIVFRERFYRCLRLLGGPPAG